MFFRYFSLSLCQFSVLIYVVWDCWIFAVFAFFVSQPRFCVFASFSFSVYFSLCHYNSFLRCFSGCFCSVFLAQRLCFCLFAFSAFGALALQFFLCTFFLLRFLRLVRSLFSFFCVFFSCRFFAFFGTFRFSVFSCLKLFLENLYLFYSGKNIRLYQFIVNSFAPNSTVTKSNNNEWI